MYQTYLGGGECVCDLSSDTNIDNASNTIYYSNQTESKKNIKYYVTLNYADTKDVENAIYYEVLEGKQKVLSIDADIIGTSDE